MLKTWYDNGMTCCFKQITTLDKTLSDISSKHQNERSMGSQTYQTNKKLMSLRTFS
jgi:hypothetical protein